jgi:hypothetical protein
MESEYSLESIRPRTSRVTPGRAVEGRRVPIPSGHPVGSSTGVGSYLESNGPGLETNMPVCKDCFYSRPIGSEAAVSCQRYPPTIIEVKDLTVKSHFPLVNNESWCGEWKRQVNGKAVSDATTRRRR